MKVLILCTGNSCRSQMAEGLLRNIDPGLKIFSAGTRPEKAVNPNAVAVMAEHGIDISHHHPDPVDKYVNESFDYVITVCDNARKICPVFTGDVKSQIHIGFEDPADATGTKEEVLAVYRKVRDQIEADFARFYNTEIKPKK